MGWKVFTIAPNKVANEKKGKDSSKNPMTRCDILHLVLNMNQIYNGYRPPKDVISHERTIRESG